MQVKNTHKVFNLFGKKVVDTAKSILKAKGKNASGKLADSLSYDLHVYPSGALELSFKGAGYAKFVDKGVKGSKSNKKAPKSPYKFTNKQPPSGAIDKWVVRKGLKAARNEKGQFIKRKSLVFLIARSIKLYGLEATNFFTGAVDKNIKTLPPQIARAYAKDAAKFIRTVTKDI